MNCAFDKEKLTGYYDGELEAAEKAEVERHIASCSECLRELGELKSAALLVKELPRLRAPRSIAEGVSRELKSAGKVHVLAKVRRNVLWASAAAAALFIGVNVVYFSRQESAPPADMAVARPAPVAVKPPPPPTELAARELGNAPARRAPEPSLEEAERNQKDEARKSVARQENGAAERKLEEAKKAEPAPEPLRDRGVAKSEEKPAAAPAPAAPRPAAAEAPARPPAPVAKSEPAKPAELPADKAPLKKDADAGAKADELKAKQAAAVADAGPTHLTLASTQMAKARPQVEETLRKMGVLPPSQPMIKGARAATRPTDTFVLELTESQIVRLREELEKPGTSRLVTGKPEDPVLAQFRTGGVFAPKEGSAPGGSVASAKPRSEPKAESKDSKDSKEGDDAVTGKALAESAVEKSVEARRKVVLHLMEVPALPDRQPAGDPAKK